MRCKHLRVRCIHGDEILASITVERFDKGLGL